MRYDRALDRQEHFLTLAESIHIQNVPQSKIGSQSQEDCTEKA